MSRAQLTSTVEQNSAGAAAPVVGYKNFVANGGVDIWQRGTSFANPANGYTADRWLGSTATAGTVSRQATNDTTNLPNIQYCLRYQRTNGSTSTANLAISQSLETVNSIPLAGKTVTLSLYARAGANYSVASNGLSVQLFTGTGTDQNVFTAGYTGSVTAIGQVATLTTTWQRFSYTATLASNITEIGIQIAGLPTGTAGANDYFEVTGIQLEVGSVATPFSRAGGTLQGELSLCQRYYWQPTSASWNYARFVDGKASGTNQAYFTIRYPVTMRTAASFNSSAASNFRLFDGATAIGVSTLQLDAATEFASSFTATPSSSLTQYRPYELGASGSTSANLQFSAEL